MEEERITVCEYLNGEIKQEVLLDEFDLKKCVTCDFVMLSEHSHSYENDDDVYCDTCWEAR